MTDRILRRLALWVACALLTAAQADARPPNILIAIADDWSATHASIDGRTWLATPAFDRVAREGLRFTRAYTPDAKCAPSRSAIVTGRNPWQLEAAANHWAYFPVKFKTFAEALRDAGYFTGLTGKGWEPGIALQADGSPRHLLGKQFDARKATPPTPHISPLDYAANFVDFLAAAPKDRPWCFWFGSKEPHRGYEYGSGVAKTGRTPASVDRVPGFLPDNETVRTDLLDYAYEIEHFDRHLGRMLAELEARGELDNTLVIVTSDNGMPFPRVKGQAYEFSNHIPLALRWPGHAQPATVDRLVSLVDLAPTILRAAGLDWSQSGLAPSAGHDLLAARTEDGEAYVLVGKERHDVGRPHDEGYPIRGLLRGHWLYLRNYTPDRWPAGNPETGYMNVDGGPTKTSVLNLRRQGETDLYWRLAFGRRPAEEVYDLQSDPECLRNLAAGAERPPVAAELETFMLEQLRAQGDPRALGHGDVFATYPTADKNSRSFYDRFMSGEVMKPGWITPTDVETTPIP